MKNLGFLLFLLFSFTTVPLSLNAEENEIFVYVDYEPLEFSQPPVIKDGRTLVPLRGIFEAFGVEVEWDSSTKTVTSNGYGKEVILTIDSKVTTINGEQHMLDVPSQLINGRTMIPLRYVSEAYGSTIDWIPEERSIYIETSELVSDNYYSIQADGTVSQLDEFLYSYIKFKGEAVNVMIYNDFLSGNKYYEAYHLLATGDVNEPIYYMEIYGDLVNNKLINAEFYFEGYNTQFDYYYDEYYTNFYGAPLDPPFNGELVEFSIESVLNSPSEGVVTRN